MSSSAPDSSPISALLLDMDGVLAEVSESYRVSIVKTCHRYNAKSVTLDTVAEWKARGGCNNDWVLSLDLISESKDGDKGLTLDEVTETFEDFYQGTETTKGLCELETLIPRKDLLGELHSKVNGNMAVVTGRPRKDCDSFLNHHGIGKFFKVCVCMEDGPPKPDPFPVSEACKLLGVSPSSSVIMVGDTPDDITSALRAEVRGVGVATPEAAEAAEKIGQSHDSGKLCQAMKACSSEKDITIIKPGLEELLTLLESK